LSFRSFVISPRAAPARLAANANVIGERAVPSDTSSASPPAPEPVANRAVPSAPDHSAASPESVTSARPLPAVRAATAAVPRAAGVRAAPSRPASAGAEKKPIRLGGSEIVDPWAK